MCYNSTLGPLSVLRDQRRLPRHSSALQLYSLSFFFSLSLSLSLPFFPSPSPPLFLPVCLSVFLSLLVLTVIKPKLLAC